MTSRRLGAERWPNSDIGELLSETDGAIPGRERATNNRAAVRHLHGEYPVVRRSGSMERDARPDGPRTAPSGRVLIGFRQLEYHQHRSFSRRAIRRNHVLGSERCGKLGQHVGACRDRKILRVRSTSALAHMSHRASLTVGHRCRNRTGPMGAVQMQRRSGGDLGLRALRTTKRSPPAETARPACVRAKTQTAPRYARAQGGQL